MSGPPAPTSAPPVGWPPPPVAPGTGPHGSAPPAGGVPDSAETQPLHRLTGALPATRPGGVRARSSVPDAPAERPAAPTGTVPAPRPVRRPGTFGPFHVAQLMWWQAAAIAIAAAVATGGPLTWPICAVVGLLLAPTVVPGRRGWLHQRLAVRLRHRLRRREFRPGRADLRVALLRYLDPSAVTGTIEMDGEPVGALATLGGLTAVFELHVPDAATMLDAAAAVPSPAALLPADDTASSITVQVLVRVSPAPPPGGTEGPAAASYRELVKGEAPLARRCLLAVRAHRTSDAPDDDDLRPILMAAVRRLRRRLRKDGTSLRLLQAEDLLAVTAEFAGLGATRGTYSGQGTVAAREELRSWTAAGAVHATYRLTRWTGPDVPFDHLVRDLPAGAVTLSVAATGAPPGTTARPPGARRTDPVLIAVSVRLTAADERALHTAGEALADRVRHHGGRCERLAGEQRAGLRMTLPFGALPVAGRHTATGAAVRDLGLKAGGGGLVIGRDRRQQPVVVRAFRDQPTRIVAFGILATTQLTTLRALALGVEVLVQTLRPGAWAGFVQWCAVPPDNLRIGPPGLPPPLPSPGRAQLVVLDIGPAGVGNLPEPAERRTVLVSREELATIDLDLMAGADLVLMERLTDVSAAIAAAALQLRQAQDWLPRIGPGMIAVYEPGRLSWCMLMPTDVDLRFFVAPAPQG